jgi:predicted dinucleotide-binding enzyme
MRIGIVGSGQVARTLGGKLASGGHDVKLGTREPEKLRDWISGAKGTVSAGSVEAVAKHGEVVLNATAGTGSLAALESAGRANLEGKILIDVANPLDFSKGMPPTLTIVNTSSLGEEIQRVFPGASVVKALNTVNADVMIAPDSVAGGDHHLFICGNDAAAKERVTAWLKEWFGWRHVLDLGDITAARGTEMYMPLWLRLWGAVGTPHLNVKVVKENA